MVFFHYEKKFLELIKDPKKLVKENVEKVEFMIKEHKMYTNPWFFFFFVLHLNYFKSSYKGRLKYWKFIDLFLESENFVLLLDQIEDDEIGAFCINF